MAGALGRRLRREGKRGNPLRSGLRGCGPGQAPSHGDHHRALDRDPVCRLAPGNGQLREFHEGRENLLSQDSVRLAVLHLRDLPGCRHRSIPLDPVTPAARKRSRRPRCDQSELGPMNPVSPFALCVMAIVALTLLGLPIGHAMIGGSVLYLLMTGLDVGTAAEQLSNGMYSSFVLLAIPLFILAAEFMTIGSITERLLSFCNAFVGRYRGGLAQVNVVQSIVFSSMSGSALADAASSGKLMQKMMTQDGKYPAAYAAALTAVFSVIAPLIPPSIPLVIYALVSDTAVRYLFLAGVIPGLLLRLAQMLLIPFTARRRNFPVEKPVPLRDIPRISWEAMPAL